VTESGKHSGLQRFGIKNDHKKFLKHRPKHRTTQLTA